MTTTANAIDCVSDRQTENSLCATESLLRQQIHAFRKRLETESESAVPGKRRMLDNLDEMEVALDLANMSCC